MGVWRLEGRQTQEASVLRLEGRQTQGASVLRLEGRQTQEASVWRLEGRQTQEASVLRLEGPRQTKTYSYGSNQPGDGEWTHKLWRQLFERNLKIQVFG
ncbi:unnamed protein product [Merluccius merluccius]